MLGIQKPVAVPITYYESMGATSANATVCTESESTVRSRRRQPRRSYGMSSPMFLKPSDWAVTMHSIASGEPR
jgi:hypothetical protein